MKFIIAEVLIVIILLILLAIFFRKKITRKALYIFAGLMIVCGFISSNIVNLLPIPTESITITALNLKNENSSETQVALASIVVDGKEYRLDNPSEGKWFWRGEYYFWRPDSDTRRPDGLTEMIEIEVPIGNHRTIGFDSWVNRGIVKINDTGTETVVDTYGERSNTILYTTLNKTKPLKVITFKLLKLALFALVIVAFVAYPVFAYLRFGGDKIKGWFSRNWDKLCYASCGVILFVFSVLFSEKQSFWGDEVHNLAWAHWESSHLSFADLVHYNATLNDTTPPLFNVIEHFWLCIVPYGQKWALMLPALITAIGVYFVGITANKLCGKSGGVCAAAMAGFSAPLYIQCTLELRTYCLLFTLSAIVLYCYIVRFNGGMRDIKQGLLYTFSLTLLIYSHYYGFLIMGMLFVADAILFFCKKAKFFNVIPYVISVVLFIPWVVTVMKNAIFDPFNKTWNSVPNLGTFNLSMQYLSGSVELISVMVLAACVFVFVNSIIIVIKDKALSGNSYIYIITSSVPFVVFSIYIYSAYISEFSKWHDRYFVCVIPFLLVTAGAGFSKLCCFLREHINIKSLISISLCILFYYSFNSIAKVESSQAASSPQYLYREAAEYIMAQNDIYDKETVALITHAEVGGTIGWDYYLTLGGKRDGINRYSAYNIDEETLCEYKTIYLFVAYSRSNILDRILDDKFEQVGFDKNTNVYRYIRKDV